MAASRVYNIEGLGDIKVTKKKGLKRINMRLHHSGEARVSIPYYLPFSAGITFAKSQSDWILRQQSKQKQPLFMPDMSIGKDHALKLISAEKLSTRVSNNTVTIKKPANLDIYSAAVISVTKKAVKRALAVEAEYHLPSRVQELATKYDYAYKTVETRPMKTRWGSCSSQKVIALNIYLMMMPWPIIDYVILHELAHTKQMNHGPEFWNEVQSTTPNYKDLKKQLKNLQPEIHALYC